MRAANGNDDKSQRNSEVFSKSGFLKRYLLPVLWIFLVPVISLCFFLYTQSELDAGFQGTILSMINADPNLPEQEKADLIQFHTENPVSSLLVMNNEMGDNARISINDTARYSYLSFHWMIVFAKTCLYSSISIFLATIFAVVLSTRSQNVQYWSLSVGWYLLKLFAVVQVICQGCLLVALSFWVTAWFFEVYIVKLILFVSIIVLCAVAVLIKAIFYKTKSDFSVEGKVLAEEETSQFWQNIYSLSAKMGVNPPKQIIAGIDDNFFVTEHPVIVDGKKYHGKTLYISLSLLKKMTREEADAVLSHELAHFSGEDTLYSQKISPLLSQFHYYLVRLREWVTYPVYSFMLFFWSLYQISINKLGREREFRADKLAAELISPESLAHSLIKLTAYSGYRQKVESLLFDKDHIIDNLGISDRVAGGFPAYVKASVDENDMDTHKTVHPFDSHPTVGQRLEAVGVNVNRDYKETVLLGSVTDSWFNEISRAEELEKELWAAYEDKFKKAHEISLTYRYLPENEDEKQLVEKYFPEITLQAKKNASLIINYYSIYYTLWDGPVRFDKIKNCSRDNSMGASYLDIGCERGLRRIKLNSIKAKEAEVIGLFEKYYSRCRAAMEYQKNGGN